MSGIREELTRLSPMGVVCWTQAEKDLFVDNYGCVPPGMVYEISDGPNAGIWVAAKNEGDPDRCIATKDLLPDGLLEGGGAGQYLTTNADGDFVWTDFPTVEDGDSAYDIWLANGNTGTQADFLASLMGDDGENICDLTAATPAQVDDLDGSETVGVCIGGNALGVTLNALGLPASGGSTGGTGPFSDGQNPDDWRFNLDGSSTSGTLPAGPTANGYWHIEVVGDGTTVFTPGTTEPAGGEPHGIAAGGATFAFTPTPGGGGALGGIRGHWVAL